MNLILTILTTFDLILPTSKMVVLHVEVLHVIKLEVRIGIARQCLAMVDYAQEGIRTTHFTNFWSTDVIHFRSNNFFDCCFLSNLRWSSRS